jgi:adenine-specific DNA methylase
MGSKRAMLQNGLGELLEKEVPKFTRFVDLFSGSGAVCNHVASRYNVPSLAFDLQAYSAILAGAIIHRKSLIYPDFITKNWVNRAISFYQKRSVPIILTISSASVLRAREWCANQIDLPITRAYGGHYFSPEQAVWLDALRFKIPKDDQARTVAIAAIIHAASECAAAPGHTAQPFQFTETSKKYLSESWSKDPIQRTLSAFNRISAQHARRIGKAQVKDANIAAKILKEDDLVFIDPPYSAVQYSRFYHVFETVASGACGEVSGSGRYPSSDLRPKSAYSAITKSSDALNSLLETISERGATGILTFPAHECSNGLSGKVVKEIAREHFRIRVKQVKSKFSTMGGTGDGRPSSAGRATHHHAKELVLVLDQK